MPASVQISADSPQTAGVPFDVDVIVSGAPAGATVTVVLSQTSGKKPFWGPATNTKLVGASGTVTVTFRVTLGGPTLATLLAEVSDDQGTYYPPATKAIDVL